MTNPSDGFTVAPARVAALVDQLGLDVAPRPAPRRPSARYIASEVAKILRAFSKALSFELKVPGQHGDGVSNQDMLNFRVAEKRDFAANSATLRRRVLAHLGIKFARRVNLPTAKQLRDTAAEEIEHVIVDRIDGKLRDVRIKTLKPSYWKWKRKHGGAGKPVGVLTGAWRRAVVDRGRIVFVTSAADDAIREALGTMRLDETDRDSAERALRRQFGTRVNVPSPAALRRAARGYLA